jgi:membrane associated rhomboid family serine protease
MFWFLPLKVEDGQEHTKIPFVNGLIIILNVLLFFCDWKMATGEGGWLSVFSVLTYAFGHANALHLIGNMWFLLVFGTPLNRRLGNAWYLLVYLASAIFVGLCALLLAPRGLIGASGAIFTVVILCGFLFAGRNLHVFYFALFPFSIIPGLLHKPKSLVYWFIRWDSFRAKMLWWALIFVPALEFWHMLAYRWGDGNWQGSWNWTHLGHLAGAVFGVFAVLLLPKRITHYQTTRAAAI